eukprot:GHVS01028313.1.p1 GENE.GHVS01028313.1~~GHVS01028313.1.p1  ORF type:complete len:353 (-),score=63.84 GHVS01028313.1:1187-2245(-)
MIVRATTHVERGKHEGKEAIVVTEMPYGVNKSAVVEKLATLASDKVVDGIAGIRDESDRTGCRVVVDVKRSASVGRVLARLFALSSLQTVVSAQLVALAGEDGKTPSKLNLRTALQIWIDFRFRTVRRRCKAEGVRLLEKQHITQGLLKVFGSLDHTVAAIRCAPDNSTAKQRLQEKPLSLSAHQADAVMKLTLSRLTIMEGETLRKQLAENREELQKLGRMMEDDAIVYEDIIRELKEMKDKYGWKRRTKLEKEKTLEAMKKEEESFDVQDNNRSLVIAGECGDIKRMPVELFVPRYRGTHGTNGGGGIGGRQLHCAYDRNTLLCLTREGTMFTLPARNVRGGCMDKDSPT